MAPALLDRDKHIEYESIKNGDLQNILPAIWPHPFAKIRGSDAVNFL